MGAVERWLDPRGDPSRQVRRFLAEKLGPGGEDSIWLTSRVTEEVVGSGGVPWKVGMRRRGRCVLTCLDYRLPWSGGAGSGPVLSSGLILLLTKSTGRWRHSDHPRKGVRTLWLEMELEGLRSESAA